MSDPLKMRRVRLLWEGYKSVPKGEAFALDSNEARAAEYEERHGGDYYEVLKFDVVQLEKEGAIVVATEHRAYELLDYTPYWITAHGVEMLRAAGYV